MNRREFLASSAGLTALLFASEQRAQVVSPRVAVVIGVDKVNDLPLLQASHGAAEIAQWLQNEGFEVKLLVDTLGPVTLDTVFRAVAEFVNRSNVEMLVVYFAGHGFMSNTNSEWWVLSDALTNPNNAVGFVESVGAAKMCGIPNIVFISDACRSTPQSLRVGNVRGGVIFPISGGVSGQVDVDRFMATSAGSQAIELAVDESVAKGYQGIFTASFLEAFKQPESSMVRKLDDATSIVPNRALKKYLIREVARRAQQKSIMENQVPDIEVNSDDMVFIGRALGLPKAASSQEVVSIESVIDLALKDAGSRFSNNALTNAVLQGLSVQDVADYSVDIGFTDVMQSIEEARTPRSFESKTGFSFSGARVMEAAAIGRGTATLLAEGELVRIDLSSATSGVGVLVRFLDGSGTLLPALEGFIGNVTVSDAGITNVSYVPSENTPTWSVYAIEADEIRRRQSVFSAAAIFGNFPIDGNRKDRSRKAESMLEDVLFSGRYDPTLSLYAAYACWNANIVEPLAQMSKRIEFQFGFPFFDVQLLSGEGGISRDALPFFPMLAQGWELLRVYGAETQAHRMLKPHLLRSAWTTFDQAGTDLLFPVAMQSNGNFQ
jgi:hypothetical protein